MTESELILELVKLNSSYIEVIKNDLSHLNADVAVLKSQMAELMWMTRVVTGAVLGIVIERGARIYIGWKDKNNKK